MISRSIKKIILTVFLWNTIFVFSQKDTLIKIVSLNEIQILSNSQKKQASLILKKASQKIKYNYPFHDGVNYKIISLLKKSKDSVKVEFFVSFDKLFSSKVQIISIVSNEIIKYNHLFHVIYANLKWAKNSNGKIFSFKEDFNYYFIQTVSEHQFNFFKIRKKDYSYEKIEVVRSKKGEKVINCENSKLELTFFKVNELYHPNELILKCYNDIGDLDFTHNLSFIKTLPYNKFDKNNNETYRILSLYTDN